MKGKRFAWEKPNSKLPLNALDIWLIAFGILVAIGAVGGSVAGYLHFRRSGQLQTILGAENLESIAQANARALEARLALEKFKAPPEFECGLRQMIEALAPFMRS